jgi:hypothetical protein
MPVLSARGMAAESPVKALCADTPLGDCEQETGDRNY